MSKKILIIDNDLVQVEFFKQGLKRHNYTVIANPTGMDVSSQLEREKPDLVLISVSGIGDEIFQCLKKHIFPFIAVCSTDDLSTLEDLYAIGALGVLLKPININQLVIEIETAIHFYHEKLQLNRRKDNINTTIENNRKISLAIGLVMERYMLTGEDAFKVLRSAARNNQSRILDVANKLIKEHEKTLGTLLDAGALSLENANDVNSSDAILNKIIETIKVKDV